MDERHEKTHRVRDAIVDMDQLADGTSKQLFSLGTLLKLAALGSSVAGPALAAYVAFITQP